MKKSDLLGMGVYAYNSRCGKFAHPNRASAKEHAKKLRRTGEHVRAYLCVTCGLFHVGHLPQAVMEGRCSSDHFYDRTA